MSVQGFADAPPIVEHITDYDKRHLVTYLRLLDAANEQADWREVVQVIFGLDAALERERAQQVHDRHLARARWMTRSGYRHLLTQATP